MMGTDPTPRSHRERRTTPRRAEDTALHYARENLLAAALVVADRAGLTLVGQSHLGAPLDPLRDAAAVYRAADAAAHSEERPKQPEIRWVHEEFGGGDLVSAHHDGPCVFVDRQCTCGRLDLGIVRADPPS